MSVRDYLTVVAIVAGALFAIGYRATLFAPGCANSLPCLIVELQRISSLGASQAP